MSKEKPRSTLYDHTASSLSRQLATMEAHPAAFAPRTGDHAHAVEVTSVDAARVATEMYTRLQTSDESMEMRDKRMSMTFAFSDIDGVPANSRTFMHQRTVNSRIETGLSRMLPSPPSDIIPDAYKGVGQTALFQRNMTVHRDASVSSGAGAGRPATDAVALRAKVMGKRFLSLSAFNSEAHHAKDGFSPTDFVQLEQTEDGPIKNRVMTKRVSPVVIGRIPKPLK